MKKVIIIFSILTFYFSLISAQQGTWFWGAEGIGDATVWSIASDAKGNCYLAGMFPNDTIHFLGYNLINSTITNPPYSSNFDGFLVKYSPDGNVLWAKQTLEKNINPNVGNNAPIVVCTDDFGNVYLSGEFVDTLFIGGDMLINKAIGPNPQSMYLAKYDANGNELWAKQAICAYNDTSFINSEQISCDKIGDIYVSGVFGDTIHIGAFTIVGRPLYYFHSFIVKYDSSGNVKWAKQSKYTGDHSDDINVSNATDGFSNAFVTGDFQDTVSFGSYTLMGGTNADFYLVKYDSSGNVKWAKQNTEILGGSSQGSAVVTDQTGNIYATGWFVGGVVFAQDTLITPLGQGSFFLVKYDSAGNLLWAKEASVLDNNTWNSWSLSIDNSKHLYLSADGGYQNCKIAFGGDTLSMNDTAKYDGASVIFKLDSNGNALCSTITPAGSLGGYGGFIASDTSGNHVYFGASASTIAIFGKDTVNPLSYPANVIQGGNFFPFVARWEECDSNVLYASVQNPKPVGAEVKIYPNPNNGTFTLALQDVNEPAKVEIYNMLGEVICKKSLNPTNTSINLTGQPAGMYFYRAITNTGSLIGEGKVVIEK